MQAGRFDLAQCAGRPGEGQQVTLVAQCSPAGPGAFEEIQVVGAVDAQQRRTAEIGGALDIAEVAFFHLVEHMVGARRHFETGHQLAIDQLAAAVVQAVVIGIDRQHCCSPVGTGVGPLLRADQQGRTTQTAKRGSMWPRSMARWAVTYPSPVAGKAAAATVNGLWALAGRSGPFAGEPAPTMATKASGVVTPL